MSIEGKVALVTGGANGIGFCTARKLLRSGAKAVALLDLGDSGGESAAADLNNEFGKDRAIFVVCDVSKSEQLKESFKKVIDTYETLDIVVNIAGIMDDADWEIMVDINYKGIVHGTILALHAMGKYKGGNGGTIVNMSSVAGLEGIPIAPIYGGTQYAIVGFTQSLTQYYEKTGIRMLTICPGLTTTAMAARFMSTKEHAMDLLDEETAAAAMTNMQKQPPEHVASAIIQLIEKGKNGAIFISENNQPPYAVEIPSYTTLKVQYVNLLDSKLSFVDVIYTDTTFYLMYSAREFAHYFDRGPSVHIDLVKFEESTFLTKTTMNNIKNKTAIITGGASGLGFAYAHKLLQNGAKAVAILDLPTANGQAAAANLEKQFGKGKAASFTCDVSNIQQFEETFKKAVKALNGIDIVINNAGMFNDTKWEQTIHVNVCGVIKGSLLAIEHMGTHKGGKGGTLVNIASIAGLSLFSLCPVYCSSKHDVLAFSRCLAHHYERTGVRVCIICPGVTSTNLLDNMTQKLFDFVDPIVARKTIEELPTQEVDNVAEAMAKIIQTGPNGAIWVSEGEQSPYAVEILPPKKIEIPQ